MSLQRLQDFTERRVSNRLARWIFLRRVNRAARRGLISDARIEDPS